MNTMDPRTIRCKQQYEGEHYFTKNGLREFVIVQFNAVNDVIIEFIESSYRIKTTMDLIKKGLKDPFEKSCVYFEDKEKELLGAYFKTNQGCTVQVIEYHGCSNIVIKFLDTGYTTSVTAQNLRNGQIRNPFLKNKFGGYTGIGPFSTNEYKWLYRIWYDMLIRANDPEYYNNYHRYQSGVYNDAVIVKEWLNYNIFALWYTTEISKLNPNYSYDIDKDLLYEYYKDYTFGKKYYGPNTCVLIPHELNNMLIINKSAKSFANTDDFDTYKRNRENNIRSLAQKLYDDGAISKLAYDALSVYTISYSDLKLTPIQSSMIEKIKKKNHLK